MKIKEILDIDIKKSHLKKIGAALIAGVMIVGGGLCLAHEYNDCYKDQEIRSAQLIFRARRRRKVSHSLMKLRLRTSPQKLSALKKVT